ncbi:MAG: hypothetical protein AAFV07_19695 [Bacteroidota bacterium]
MKTFIPFFQVFLAYCLLPLSILGQTVSNDTCIKARVLQIDQPILNEQNHYAGLEETALPETEPVTCIKTFENDLWYQFETLEGYGHYEVKVRPTSCNTPAGLQAILIRSDDCMAENYIYIDCRNPYAEVPFSLHVSDSIPGHRYLVQVDGYDGTRCSFDIELRALADDPREPEAIGTIQMDYGDAPPHFEPESFTLGFSNNEAEISWTANSREETEFFLVQRTRKYGSRVYGRVIGKVPARNSVGADEPVDYTFVDNAIFSKGQTSCYRIVRVHPSGERAYGPIECVEVRLNEDLYVTPVYLTDQPDVYIIKYSNKRKQDLRFALFDASDTLLKELTKKKEPKADGSFTINMTDYPAGQYLMTVEGKEERFSRRFTHEK